MKKNITYKAVLLKYLKDEAESGFCWVLFPKVTANTTNVFSSSQIRRQTAVPRQ